MNLRPSVALAISAVVALLLTGSFWGMSYALEDDGHNLYWALPLLGVLSFTGIFLTIRYFFLRRIDELEAQHQEEIKRLKELENFRREFIGDVSHELKTPIFAIEGFIETLLDGALEDKKVNRKFLQKAQKQAERLSNLVSDILVITQIESGSLSMNESRFQLYGLIMEVLDSLEHKFMSKGREVKWEVRANGLEQAAVMADRERIGQVVRNLIDNAIKYGSPRGTVHIELEELPQQKLLVKVRDEGHGIPREHLPRLFERFYRVDKSRSRDKGGTGLGLAICKHFIEAHKERIWVDSTLGKGSVFQFTLSRALP